MPDVSGKFLHCNYLGLRQISDLLTACLPLCRSVILMNQEPVLALAVGTSAQNIHELCGHSLMASLPLYSSIILPHVTSSTAIFLCHPHPSLGKQPSRLTLDSRRQLGQTDCRQSVVTSCDNQRTYTATHTWKGAILPPHQSEVSSFSVKPIKIKQRLINLHPSRPDLDIWGTGEIFLDKYLLPRAR